MLKFITCCHLPPPQPVCALGLPWTQLSWHLTVDSGVLVPQNLCCRRIPALMPEVLDAAALSDAMGEQAVTCPSPAAGEAGINEGWWVGGTSRRQQSLLPLACWELSSEPCGGTR